MTTQPQHPHHKSVRDSDLVNAEIALKRAALRAREQARQNGTLIVISENGVIKEIAPESLQGE